MSKLSCNLTNPERRQLDAVASAAGFRSANDWMYFQVKQAIAPRQAVLPPPVAAVEPAPLSAAPAAQPVQQQP